MKSPDWKLIYYGPSACIFLSRGIYPPGHEISSSIYHVGFYQTSAASVFALDAGDFDVSKRLFTKLKMSPFYQSRVKDRTFEKVFSTR